MVRNAQTTDWNKVREKWESRIGAAWAKVRESGVGDRVKENVIEMKDNVIGMKDNVIGAGQDLKKDATEVAQPKRLLEIK